LLHPTHQQRRCLEITVWVYEVIAPKSPVYSVRLKACFSSTSRPRLPSERAHQSFEREVIDMITSHILRGVSTAAVMKEQFLRVGCSAPTFAARQPPNQLLLSKYDRMHTWADREGSAYKRTVTPPVRFLDGTTYRDAVVYG
jgi:hypothetical protein